MSVCEWCGATVAAEEVVSKACGCEFICVDCYFELFALKECD